MSDADDGPEPGFEDGLAALEAVVVELEAGTMSLEDALHAFERGVALVRTLNERLRAAEERVQILTRAADGSLRMQAVDEDET